MCVCVCLVHIRQFLIRVDSLGTPLQLQSNCHYSGQLFNELATIGRREDATIVLTSYLM